MKILIVQDADWMKKGPHQQHHLAEILSREGNEIHVVCFDQLWKGQHGLFSKKVVGESVSRFYKGAKVKYTRSRFVRLPIIDYISYSYFSLLDIKEEIDSFEPDIVISFTSLISSWLAMKLANARKIPNVYYWTDVIHSLVPYNFLKPVAKIIEGSVVHGSTKVMAINEVLKDFIVDSGINSSKVEIIPGGIDFQRFDPAISGQEIRQKYGLGNDDTVMFFMGWLYDFSGLKEVIIDLARHRETAPNLKLLIVGAGGHYEELKEIVKSEGMQGSVVLTGWRPYDEIPQLVAAADYCLLPSFNNEVMRDIVPIKLYEYLAMNKPIIATRLPGIVKEFGKCAGITYVDGPHEVISTVLRFDRGKYFIEKDNASTFIRDYGWDSLVPRFEDSLENIVEGN